MLGYYIYSNSLESMILKRFKYKGKIHEWNDYDCVYYWGEADGDYFMEVHENVIPLGYY